MQSNKQVFCKVLKNTFEWLKVPKSLRGLSYLFPVVAPSMCLYNYPESTTKPLYQVFWDQLPILSSIRLC